MRWIRHDEKHRRPHLENIIYVVRCYFLPPSFLEQQLKFCDVLKSHPNCRQYLQKVMSELTAHKKCQMRKRRNPDLPMVIYVAGGYHRYSLNRLESFDPKTKIWRSLASMPTFRSGVCTYLVSNRTNCWTDGVATVHISEIYGGGIFCSSTFCIKHSPFLCSPKWMWMRRQIKNATKYKDVRFARYAFDLNRSFIKR